MLAIRMAKSAASIVLIGLLVGCAERVENDQASAASEATSVPIVPAPREVARGAGTLGISRNVALTYSDVEARKTAEYFAALLKRTTGIAPTIASEGNSQTASVRFTLDRDNATPEGAYTLAITHSGVSVSASTPAGLFYGAVTLWQLFTASVQSAEIVELPLLTIDDEPRFEWRGLMIDSARHFQTIDELKQIVDAMALHKMNVLHWHLTDDQSWRLEIKKYPKLTSVGAWRVPAGAAPAADMDPATGKPRLYGGFYTQEQARELVAYAAERHITVVPEIEMPGHASAAIAAYPELAVFPETNARVPADWGIYENLFNVEESTFAFLEDVLTETMSVFPGEYIHVGGDEAVKKQWESSPRVKARMKEFGVKNTHELQSYFIQRMEKFLNRHDRRLIGWDEILEGGLAPNATVMSWRGIEGAVAAATAGHDTVLSPWPILYFDNRPLDTANPPGRGRVISVEDVYRFDPMPAALTEDQRKHVLGVQANVWTEHIRTAERLQYMVLPRLAALAEIAWSSPERIDWESFSARLPEQYMRYEQVGLRYANPKLVVPATGAYRSSHQLALCSDKLPLALEDDASVQGERAVFFVDIMQPCWIYKDATIGASTSLRASVGQVPFNFQIGDSRKEIPLRRPATPAGELEVRLDSCEGQPIAVIPLASAVDNQAVTQLPAAALGNHSGTHDLCFAFTQHDLDPTWVIESVELIDAAAE